MKPRRRAPAATPDSVERRGAGPTVMTMVGGMGETIMSITSHTAAKRGRHSKPSEPSLLRLLWQAYRARLRTLTRGGAR